ncbi:MAG: hypothetical protein A2Y33_11620 [Spirochaetes bacterium GWF1_51_8]|nr:MAG: hypothetical protein A2Y33_11620 [Spirochaetes bacterium GWF1_51_8]
MYREYSVSFFGYLLFGVFVVLTLVFIALPKVVIGIIQYFQGGISLSYFAIFGLVLYFFLMISFFISDTFLATIHTPFNSYWRIYVREDGLYGTYLWEFSRWVFKRPRKICNWEDIKRVKFRGYICFAFYRSIVYLKNDKKFSITNIGISPYEIDKYYHTENEYEKSFIYSNRMLYALIMRRIGIENFEDFKGPLKGGVLEEIRTALTETDRIIEEDKNVIKEMEERKKQIEQEEEEERKLKEVSETKDSPDARKEPKQQ